MHSSPTRTKPDTTGIGPCHSLSSVSTAAAVSIKSADTSASGGSKLLFGEIDTGSEQSLNNYASICDFVQCGSSTFLRFWLDDRCRENFLSFLPKDDLKAFRLTCHGISARAAPEMFRDLHITFRTNTFTKPAKMAALDCIGYHVRKLSFGFPQTAESSLPPLVNPTTGTEMGFTYIPRVERSNTQDPKYGDVATTEALTRQYPAIFHASTNASALQLSGEGRTEHCRLRIDVATLCGRAHQLSHSSKSVLDVMVPNGLQYLMPHAGYGTTPASTRVWSRIQHLTLRLITQGDRKEQQTLHRYLRSFHERLTELSVRWEGHRGPFPLIGLPHTAMTKAGASRVSHKDQIAVQPSIGSARLKRLIVCNAQASAAEINALIGSNNETLHEVELQDVELTEGEWQDVFTTSGSRPLVKPRTPELKTLAIPDKRPVAVKPLPALPLQSPRSALCSLGPMAASNRREVHQGYCTEDTRSSKKRRSGTYSETLKELIQVATQRHRGYRARSLVLQDKTTLECVFVDSLLITANVGYELLANSAILSICRSSPASKRRRTPGSSLPKRVTRAASPAKDERHISWKRRLEQGPTPAHANHRHQSPVRSAMAERRFATDSDGDDKMYMRGIGDPGRFNIVCDIDDTDESLPSRTMSPARTYTQGDPPLGSPYPDDAHASNSSSDIEAAAPHRHSQTMDTLKQMIQQYAEGFSDLSSASDPLSHLLQPQHAETIRYVGCLALGGPDGTDSWKQLLQSSGTHKALIFGVVARALKEHVFGALWFGATPQQERELNKTQEDLLDKDGRDTSLYQPTVLKIDKEAQNQLTKAKDKLLLQLQQLLLPIVSVSTGKKRDSADMRLNDLAAIIALAADLSRWMRQLDEVVYYWPPTFKDEEFEPGRMECVNLRQMLDESPYQKLDIQGRMRPRLQPGQEHRNEAIVRVVCFPGLVAYRQGGGELGGKVLAEQDRRRGNGSMPRDVQIAQARSRDNVGVDDGYRTKVICKAVGHLTWGKQRLLTREAGTSAHLDAMRDHSNKYLEDRKGFKELWDIFCERLISA
ncbi:hypothetical protein D0859_02907 [Hortaea werneckii]|uniref:Uncharacterized protein n=1 Tax=Hortaea werneckii TaxID=91943 RepID=A0A3M7J5A8_HORWE|nr:hypothetical protein D0859_02907 [Hortaea werneckii]